MSSRPRIAFIVFSRGGGGPMSFLARSCEYLAVRADITLIDEAPADITRLMTSTARTAVQTLTAPVWDDVVAARTAIRQEFAERPPDWIVVNNPAILLRFFTVLRAARREYGSRLQYTNHSLFLTPTPIRRAIEFGASFALAFADRVTCVSDFTRRVWHRRYPWTRTMRFEVIHHGVAPADVFSRRTRVPLRIGFVGRLVGEKDPILFGEIALLSKARGLPFEFHVFGHGPLQQEMESRFGDAVMLRGHRTLASDIFREIDVLAMTSPIENCPNALLEAKSWGVPCVAAPVGGIPELIEHDVDGLLTSARTATAFLAALEGALDGYERLSDGCLVTREKFSLGRHTASMWCPLLDCRRQNLAPRRAPG
jgi:glycosyltransferase involved in cell wall biosynthesis